jgi:hypothetical protein
MRSLALALALWLVGSAARAADSAAVSPRPDSGLFAWYLVFVAAILAAGVGLVPDWVRRRRRDRAIREAVAVPVQEPAISPGEDRRPPFLRSTDGTSH